MEGKKKVLVIGVIGADVHAVGNKILYHAFTQAAFDKLYYIQFRGAVQGKPSSPKRKALPKERGMDPPLLSRPSSRRDTLPAPV